MLCGDRGTDTHTHTHIASAACRVSIASIVSAITISNINHAASIASVANATNILDISNQAYANLWAEQSDLLEYAWTSSEGERDRQNSITLSHLAAQKDRTQAEMEADLASSNAMGDFVGKLLLGSFGF